ncbi:MAG: response regulator, partial [candidate division NC10 bacterium]|nr:response regulator [candidate division NC10 bacterium]
MKGRYADKTILLVEETRFFRETVEEALKQAGFRVLSAATGMKGREVLEAEGHRVDLLVLDLHLTPVDGFDFLEHLRHLKPPYHPPILAMLLGLE